MRQHFDITITPELSNILELIKTENYYIYFLMDSSHGDGGNHIDMAYVFKKTCVKIDGHDCISCIAVMTPIILSWGINSFVFTS